MCANGNRSGMAARASGYFRNDETKMALWYKEMQRHAPSSAPDMHVRIVTVLAPPRRAASLSYPVVGIALCEIKSPRRATELRKILFSFSQKHIKDSQLEAFQVGQWVAVWKPWQTARTERKGQRQFPRVALPLPSSTQLEIEDLARLPVGDEVIVCRKFVYCKE